MAVAVPDTQPEPELSERLAALLTETLRALGDAGEPVQANRIAGRAWSALRHSDPKAANKINGLMHRLARQEDALAAAPRPDSGSG